MTRIKKWICKKYLPAYARENMIEESGRMQKKIVALEQENRELRAYIDGLERGVRAGKKIVINAAGFDR